MIIINLTLAIPFGSIDSVMHLHGAQIAKKLLTYLELIKIMS
jgi:hypothetical protein